MLTQEEQEIRSGNGRGNGKDKGNGKTQPPENPGSNTANSSDPVAESATPEEVALALTAASQAVSESLNQAVQDMAKLTSDIRMQRDRITEHGANQIIQLLDPNLIQCEALLKAFVRRGEVERHPFVVEAVELPSVEPHSSLLRQVSSSLLALASGFPAGTLPAGEN